MKYEQENKGLHIPELEKDSCGVGLIADLKATPSHYVIDSALTMLERMEHRGACGCEENTGDGAGILTQIPFAFLNKVAESKNITLPAPSQYGLGMFFFPKNPVKRAFCDEIIQNACQKYQFDMLLTRHVPVDNSMIGHSALETEPDIVQIALKPIQNKNNFLDLSPGKTSLNLEKQLYFLRTEIMKNIYQADASLRDEFYIVSLSSKTVVYKGQLMATQLRNYFADLRNKDFLSCVAIVHSRFSTNTVPKWKLAQPFRCIAHNGEINTIQGNINWWEARERYMEKSGEYNDSWINAIPVCDPYQSDSGNFDNVIDFLSKTTRSIPHAMMMMIPEAWQNDTQMPTHKRSFYEYHNAVLEPWDGPAAICFTDGNLVGATLDRNGLRPARYIVTDSNMLILASEEGCIDIDPSTVIKKGRLQAGNMLVADLEEQRIISDMEVKDIICKRLPYSKWLEDNAKHIDDFPFKDDTTHQYASSLKQRQTAFGFSKEDEELVLKTMLQKGKEPIGSMGADIPLAVLSKLAQHPANYFKQQFAQVTNPPIDSLREKYFMSLYKTLGGTSRILNIGEAEATTIRLDTPFLTFEQYNGLASLNTPAFKAKKIDTSYPKEKTLKESIHQLCMDVDAAIQQGFNLFCLSDSAISANRIAIPSLLAIGAVHHFLIQSGDRKEVDLVVHAGDIWETQHFATLISYGADAICPYLAMESIINLANKEQVPSKKAVKTYQQAVNSGLLKIMSKLGVSTIHSYQGAQTFEALGIGNEVIDKCFKGTVSRLGGMNFDDLQKENEAKHNSAFAMHKPSKLADAGVFQWKRTSEYHLFNPKTIHLLQYATRQNDYAVFKKYTKEIDSAEKNASTLRSFFQIKKADPIPIETVESIDNILKRFATGAMSFGSISHEAHTTLAIAMNQIGGKSNSGEGGEDEKRFSPKSNGDWERSAIKQVASGRFGVTINYLTHADEIQIKMAQGAKPGEGGHLPGHKVDKNIARVRHSTPGVGLISPPPHHDIYSIEDLAQLIFDLKNANPNARISVKLVSKTGVGVIASGVTKAHADHILISGHDGGTGASPLSSIRHAGLPWELGLAETHQTLVKNKLRDRVTIQCDGQIRTGRDMAIATMLGAEEWGIATAALVVEGCILMRKCHLNTCPVGIATQDVALRKKFNGKVDHLVNYFRFLAQDLREIMAECGIKTINELVGRSDLLEIDKKGKHWKTQQLNLDQILYKPTSDKAYKTYKSRPQNHGIHRVLDHQLIHNNSLEIRNLNPVLASIPIKNTDRAVGAMLSHEVAKRYGSKGMPDGSISIRFKGSAGQSFGAFLAKGIDFSLEGASNDYFGKGLSGGKLVVTPDRKAIFNPSKNTIIGNVGLYGATSGEAYIHGMAGDRFCVRNSGATAVVEGIGDNGCEYMTGGHVLILGSVGRNFAAGMSGGVAYVYKSQKKLDQQINTDLVLVEEPDDSDLDLLKEMVQNHFNYTASNLALDCLNDWYELSQNFIKIIPIEYKAVLLAQHNKHKVIQTIAS